nr:RNA-directed DNA polymerase, eukaryota [Tanacetum cinerariifolium]
HVRGGVESQQWFELLSLLGAFISSPSSDRWICDLNGDGMFCVKDIRSYLDDLFLPSSNEATSTFSLDTTWLNLSSKEFAVGGISIGLMFRRLSSGILGSLLFGYRVSLNLFWKEFLSRLGGLFGLSGTGLFLTSLLLGVQ